MQRFGILGVLFPAFLLGTAATVGLGYGASSVALAATFIGLVGLFMGLGTAGAIALSAMIYPTPIRSTGVGWGMAMGRFGQIVGPLIAGTLLGAGWTADRIMIVIACGGLIAALFIVLFRAWFVRRDVDRNAMAGTSSAESPLST
jgi:AAHS family 4-hydroxybenzoate transporter-like MFS transporter